VTRKSDNELVREAEDELAARARIYRGSSWEGFRVGDVVHSKSARTPAEYDVGVITSLNPIYVRWRVAQATYMEDPDTLVLDARPKARHR
jgi:hypothetical protein